MINRPAISLFAIALVSTSISIFSPSVTTGTIVVDAFTSSKAATFAYLRQSSPSSQPMLRMPTTNNDYAIAESNIILFNQTPIDGDGISDQQPNIDGSPRPHAQQQLQQGAMLQSHSILNKRRKQWINHSLKYYTTVAREQKRRSRGQLPPSFPRSSPDELQTQIRQAERHYFARNLIKSGKLDQAEALYRRIIDEIQNDEDGCDHARLAVSTLLLALLKQRMNDVKGARSVFLNFFRTVLTTEYPEDKECACSAKVLQAYALFEMKRGHGRKSLEIVERAVELDEELRPVLAWKQFQEEMAG